MEWLPLAWTGLRKVANLITGIYHLSNGVNVLTDELKDSAKRIRGLEMRIATLEGELSDLRASAHQH